MRQIVFVYLSRRPDATMVVQHTTPAQATAFIMVGNVAYGVPDGVSKESPA